VRQLLLSQVESRPSGRIKDEVAALKRERIVSAAVDLFYDSGYEHTTLEAVAERLGVTKPFIYAHFKSKTELLAEICGRGIGSSLRAIDGVLAINTTPTEKLRKLGQLFVASVLENQKPIGIFTREEKNLTPRDFKRISEMRRSFDAKLTGLLNVGLRRGEFRMADPAITTLAIDGIVSWTYVWYRQNGRLSAADLADELAALILAMAGVAAPDQRLNGKQAGAKRRTKRARA
jgi:AcrR family transcriptional regulator